MTKNPAEPDGRCLRENLQRNHTKFPKMGYQLDGSRSQIEQDCYATCRQCTSLRLYLRRASCPCILARFRFNAATYLRDSGIEPTQVPFWSSLMGFWKDSSPLLPPARRGPLFARRGWSRRVDRQFLFLTHQARGQISISQRLGGAGKLISSIRKSGEISVTFRVRVYP